MDMPLNTLLVALMFVTILSMGIGNILVTLADVFNHATNVLLTEPSERESAELESFFVALGRRFLLMLAAVQAWTLVVAFTLIGGLSGSDAFNIAFGVLALVLMLNSAHRIQVAGWRWPGCWPCWAWSSGVRG